jgi:hypothetical protein
MEIQTRAIYFLLITILSGLGLSCSGKKTPRPKAACVGSDCDATVQMGVPTATPLATMVATPSPLSQTTPLPGQPTFTPTPVDPRTSCTLQSDATTVEIFDCVQKEIKALESFLTSNSAQNLSEASDILEDTYWEIAAINDGLTEFMSPYNVSMLKAKLATLKSKLSRVGIAASKSSLANSVLVKATAIANLIQTITDKLG